MKELGIIELSEKLLETPSGEAGLLTSEVLYYGSKVCLDVQINRGQDAHDLYLVEDFSIDKLNKNRATEEIQEFYHFIQNLVDLLHNE